jgi:signal transduction histidine kinase
MPGARMYGEFPADAERPPLAAALALFAILSVLGNLAGASMRYPEIGAAVMFPPYALLTVALLASPTREWKWYVLVGALAHFATHWPGWSVSWVLLADVANIARALCAAILLRRLFVGLPRLRSIGALARFIAVAALAAPAVGATLGAANAALHGATSYWATWAAWFVSNALTGLTILPALVTVVAWRADGPHRRMRASRAAEAALLAAVLAAACALAFILPSGGRWQVAVVFYAPLPVLIWAALRFGPRGASLALTAVAFIAIWGADRGTGPFLAKSPYENVIMLQTYLLLTTLPVLCIAAVNSAREGVVRLYRALLASLQDHVAILDARGVLIEVNASWQRFAESVGPAYPINRGDDYLRACRTAAEQGDATGQRALAGVTSVLRRDQRRFELEYDRDAGREAYVLTVEALERQEGGAVVTRTDVTARRRAQREVEEQRRTLAHLARVAMLGQLSGALAHELNQPLSAILNNTDAARRLLRSQPLDTAELAAILEDIASEDRRAAQVIRHLRAFFRRGETNVQSLDAGEIVREVMQLAHEEIIGRRVVATTSVEPRVLPFMGDRVELQQVLLNLVLNGCEAMSANPAGERTLSVDVRDDDGFVRFSVRDRGTGIASDVMERLFEPFVTTKPDGLGLGLSISRTIISAHGGRLWAENNADRGTTLHCLLPRAGPARPDTGTQSR